MSESKAMIESIRDYILTCPLLDEDRTVNIDYLGAAMEYSIDPMPATPVIKQYTDGGSLKQYQFTFTSKESYDGDARTGIENSGFYENFEKWINEQSSNRVLPVLTDSKQTAQYIEVLTSGYLFDSDADTARYQIQLRLIYEQEA